jgi:hypothetical protein
LNSVLVSTLLNLRVLTSDIEHEFL